MVDKEKIKKALDNFEDEDYTGSEEELKLQLKKAKNDYLKKELGLENDVEDIEPDDNNTDNDKEDEEE